jgi:hypothetical protein
MHLLLVLESPVIVQKTAHQNAGDFDALREPEKAAVAVAVALTTFAVPRAFVAALATGVYPIKKSAVPEQVPENATATSTAAATYLIIVDLVANRKEVTFLVLKCPVYYQLEKTNLEKMVDSVVEAYVVGYQVGPGEGNSY